MTNVQDAFAYVETYPASAWDVAPVASLLMAGIMVAALAFLLAAPFTLMALSKDGPGGFGKAAKAAWACMVAGGIVGFSAYAVVAQAKEDAYAELRAAPQCGDVVEAFKAGVVDVAEDRRRLVEFRCGSAA